MNETWLSLPVMRTLVDQLVQATARQYRVDPPRAAEMLKQSLGKNPSLRALVEAGKTVKQIQRTRVYKNAAADAKREVYYALRRYHREDADAKRLIEQLCRMQADDSRIDGLLEQICSTHASTRERQPHAAEFYRRLFEHLQHSTSLVDIGCGMHPLQFPFRSAPPSLSRYLALDRDRVSIRAVQEVARQQRRIQVMAVCQDLSEGWDAVVEQNSSERFDVALMFKLVAVLQRQHARLLATLAQAPAATWLISGSKQSMTKRRDISRRELAVVRQFVEGAGRSIKEEFDAGEEFVVVAE